MKLKHLITFLLCLLLFTCAKSEKEKRIVKDGGCPSVSPTENILAFVEAIEIHGEPTITGYIMDISKGEILGNFGKGIFSPSLSSWSPDGKKIAAIGFDEGKDNIWILDPWGRENPVIITNYERKPIKEWFSSDGIPRFAYIRTIADPSWSPTGELIAFVLNDYGVCSIWVVSVKDKTVEQVTSGPIDRQPDFSPDGSRITYTACDCLKRNEIMEVTLKDKSIRNLISSPFDDQAPSWSPDGKYIAFISDRDLSYQIWIRRVSDSLEFQFTQSKVEIFRNTPPTWTPDGKYILYVKMKGGIWMKEFDPSIFKPYYWLEDIEEEKKFPSFIEILDYLF